MLNSIFTRFKQETYIVLALVLYGLALYIVIPRQVGLTIRYDFSIAIPLVVLILVLGFQIPGWTGKLIALSFCLILFALPLSGLWNSGQSERYIIGGIFPFSDAYHYYMDAKRLLFQQPFSDFTARRPLFSAMLAVILSLTNQNLQITQAILVLITAFSCYLATREIQRSFGTLPAILFLIILFLFYRPLSGKTLTENLGLPLGLLGTTMIWNSSNTYRKSQAFIGLLLLTIGLNARAGAFFILPAIIIWGSCVFRNQKKISLSFFFFSILLVLSGFLINLLIFKFFTDGGAPFSNFAHTFYGLAVGGKGWTQIYTDFPKISKIPEPQFTVQVYQLAFEAIIKDPSQLLFGITSAWKMFFGTGEYSVFCYVGGENVLVSNLVKYLLYGLSLVGLIGSIIKIKNPQYSLIVATFAGILISIPFVPPIDASNMRAYAATLSVIALIPAAGLFFVLSKIKWNWLQRIPQQVYPYQQAEIFGVFLLVITIICPIIVKPIQQIPAFKEINCPADETPLYMKMYKGSYINLVPNNSISQDHVPDIRINYFLNNVHNLPNFEAFYDLDSLKENTTVIYDLDLKSGNPYMVFIDSNLVIPAPEVMGVCGKLTDNPTKVFHFFYATSATPVSIQ